MSTRSAVAFGNLRNWHEVCCPGHPVPAPEESAGIFLGPLVRAILCGEIHALIDWDFVTEIAQAMDLEDERVYELFERATDTFNKIKDANLL